MKTSLVLLGIILLIVLREGITRGDETKKKYNRSNSIRQINGFSSGIKTLILRKEINKLSFTFSVLNVLFSPVNNGLTSI